MLELFVGIVEVLDH